MNLEANDIQAAYRNLGLEIGTPFDRVNTHFLIQAKGLKPEKQKNPKKRAAIEQKLKTITEAHELLKKHFESLDHDPKSPTCACMPSAQWAETAKQFDREVEAVRAKADHTRQTLPAKSHILRWQISAVLAALLVVVFVVGWIGKNHKAAIENAKQEEIEKKAVKYEKDHEAERQLETRHADEIREKKSQENQAALNASKHSEEIRVTKNEIGRNKKIIEDAQKDIADMENQLAHGSPDPSERMDLEYQLRLQKGSAAIAQKELVEAQARLHRLRGQ